MKLSFPPRTLKIWRAVVWLFNNSIKILGVLTIIIFIWFMIYDYIYTPYINRKYAQNYNDNPVDYDYKQIGNSAKTGDTIDKLPMPKIFKSIDAAKATYYVSSTGQFYSEKINLKDGSSISVETITPTFEKDSVIREKTIAFSSKYIYFVQSNECNEGMGGDSECPENGLLSKYDIAAKQTSLLTAYDMKKYYLVDSLVTNKTGDLLLMVSHNDKDTQITLSKIDSNTGAIINSITLPEKITSSSHQIKLRSDGNQIAIFTKQINKQIISLFDTALAPIKTITLPSDSADSDYSLDNLSPDFSRYLIRREPTTEYEYQLTAYDTNTDKEINTRAFRKDNVKLSWSNDSKYVAVLGYVKDAGAATIWSVDDNKWVSQSNSNIVNRPLHWFSNNTLLSYFHADYDINPKTYFYNPYTNQFTKLNASNVFPYNIPYGTFYWEEM